MDHSDRSPVGKQPQITVADRLLPDRRPSEFVTDSAAGFLENYSTVLGERLQSIWAKITVEPLLACYIVPSVFTVLAVQNLNLDRACRVNLNYTSAVCDALARRETANFTLEEQEVQKLVASMANWKSLLQSGLPGLLILFWGSWSDRHHRRKPCMIFPIVGELITSILLVACVYLDRVPVEVVGVVETVFNGLSGSWFNMMLGVFSYIADVTTEEERTYRIGIVNLFITLGVPAGTAFSGVLLRQLGSYGVFALASCFHLCSLAYGIWFVKESRSVQSEVDTGKHKRSLVADFFDSSHLVETMRTVFKDGPKKRRLRVITLLIALMVIVGPMYGEMQVFYLFTRFKFNWSEMEFSMFSTYSMFTNLVGIMFSMAIFSKKLALDDTIVAFISSSSKIMSSFVYAFAEQPWHLYMGPIVEIFSGTSFIATRSIASKLVNSDELGKVNSLLSMSESLMPVIYGPLYANMYSATMDFMPGAYFLLGGALTLPGLGIFMWMYYIQRRIVSDEIAVAAIDGKDAGVEMGSVHVLKEEIEAMLPPQVVRDASSRQTVPVKL